MAFTCPFYFAVVCIATLVVWSKSSPAPPPTNKAESNLVELMQIVYTAESVLVNDSQLLIMYVGNRQLNDRQYIIVTLLTH